MKLQSLFMKSFLQSTLVAGCLAAGAFTMQAGPLQRGEVPGVPLWLLHIDFDAIRPSSIGQFILGEMDKPENQFKLAALQGMLKVDIRTQLHGATVYSAGAAPEDAVALVYADFDAEHLASLAKQAQDAKSITYKKHVIHNWIDDKKPARNGVKPRTYAALAGNKVIFAQREEAVKQSLDVIDGAAGSLSKSGNFSQLGAAGTVNFIEAAARKLPVPDSDPNAAILKMAKGIRFQLGETDGKISANLALEAADGDTARNIANVAQGLVGLLRLQQNNPDALKLADALAPRQDGNSVVVKLTLPSTEVVGMMKNGVARKAAPKER